MKSYHHCYQKCTHTPPSLHILDKHRKLTAVSMNQRPVCETMRKFYVLLPLMPRNDGQIRRPGIWKPPVQAPLVKTRSQGSLIFSDYVVVILSPNAPGNQGTEFFSPVGGNICGLSWLTSAQANVIHTRKQASISIKKQICRLYCSQLPKTCHILSHLSCGQFSHDGKDSVASRSVKEFPSPVLSDWFPVQGGSDRGSQYWSSLKVWGHSLFFGAKIEKIGLQRTPLMQQNI